MLRISLLHLAPITGDLEYNRRLIENSVETAAAFGAQWIITPELCVCGYQFAAQIGTDWILPQPDLWMASFCRQVARLQVTVFLSHPERDRESGRLHNTVFVIAPDGSIVGKHRKINTLRVGSESWSTPGEQIAPIPVPPFDSVGILICADAYPSEFAGRLKEQGAQMLVSPAAWGTGFHGPDGEWERRTLETGLPLLVCNRTGAERTLNFTGAESVVVKNGQRLVNVQSIQSAIITFDWDMNAKSLASPEPRVDYL